ncbi:LOW QUALITY PROTEIN: ankyrin-2 [Orussus abietinus]|uniref:LOW QUALITY PROTEIN: ankyrin-2 n=1 Tax=Orussus abietinus TaxID=222816 RepID=UPI000C715F9A|nr:LOW QUALITY PROTEIN: ankyrin-2 [Orussus abietinus]
MVTDNTSQADDTTIFLRAARSGNLEKVIEYLDTDLDINTANSNGLNALHLASKDGHVEIVTELLKRGAKVDSATKKGNTALHIASLAGQAEIVNILLQYGAAVNIQSQNGFTPLYMAAQENHDHVVKILLSNGANQSLATEDGFTPLAVAMQQGHDKVVSVLLENDSKGKVRLPALHIAAKKDDCKAADLLLQNDHKPDVTSKSGFTPLHIAAHYGNEEIARLLIKKGADVNYLAKHNISPLHVAAKWGKNNMVKILLENSAMIDAKTRDGLTPLHCAARSGHEEVVSTLLEHSAPISARTKNGLAPLHMASQGDHVEAARVLLYHRAPVDEVTIDYLTSLHVAAHCGHVRVAKLLLDRKADPNARALNGFTPLHIACKKNRIKVVELLLKHGASIESTTESGLTPLHVASFMGCMNIVIFLLQHEANPDVPTVRGETPLHLAARANQTDIIRILLRNGAKVDARAREQQTPLHIASRLGNIDIVMLLLQHGAAVDTTTKDMYTALHIAAKEGQEEVASILVENNASVKATTKNGFTPLHIAAKYGNINVAKILLQKESKIDAQGKNDITPLHMACHYDHPSVVTLLLEKGASPHVKSQNGHTPLHIAARKNQMDIATTLLEHGANANIESKAGFTPLHLSAQKGHYDMTSLLIEHGADPNHRAKNGLTAMHLCAQEDFVRVAAILVKSGANIESQTETGYRPIHVASHFGNLSMIRFLLKHNAEIDVKTNQNYTPLHQAAQQGHAHVASALIDGVASHKARTNDGLTALNIAQKLGYISVMEVLKGLPYDNVTPDNKNWEEKYKVIAPESLQETDFMSDSDDEGGSDALISEQPYRYLTADLMKSLRDDSLPIDVTRDDPIHRQVSKEEKQEFVQSNNYCLAENFDMQDSMNLGRLHFKSFLVSFLVDARGGAMKGCRHSGIRIIIPPRRATMPIRVTCRLVKPSKVSNPPPLMEGEALATRIIEMGPVAATFLGPVLIDIPHFASIPGKEREIIILRSENGETWKEHDNSADNDDTLLNTPHDPQMSAAYSGRITRIITTNFPQYFAILTRIKQEVHVIGAEGGILISSVVSHVQAVFPPGALTKKIKVGLQARVIPAELTAKLLGNCVAVSPVITIEPRRRKFHKPITLTIPVPQAANKGMINQYGGETPTLRLLCSIAGGTSETQWEDVTGSTPLTFMNDRVSFTTTVSARFWLMDCRNISEVPKMAMDLYRESLYVPFITNFVIYAKRVDVLEATLRILCMTDGKEGIHTLEKQEEFLEIVKSRDVEALDGKDLYIEFSGNLVPVMKSGVQLKFTFKAFRQNRLSFCVKVKDTLLDPVARMLFMKEPKVAKGEPPQQPICILNIVLPEIRRNIEIEDKLKEMEDSNVISHKLDSLKSKYHEEHKEKFDEPKPTTSPMEQKFITDTLEKEQTDAATIHESLAQKAACPVESVDASYPNKAGAQDEVAEKQTYMEKRRFWEDITKKRESYQRSESEVSRTSQLTINESDSECLQNAVSEEETEAVSEKSEVIVSERSEVAMSDKSEMIVSERSEVAMSEKSEVAMSEKSEVAMSEKSEVAMSEKSEVAMSEKSEVAMSEKSEVALSEKSEVPEDANVPDISECSVAEKAHYFEEQIQKEMSLARTTPKVQTQESLKSRKTSSDSEKQVEEAAFLERRSEEVIVERKSPKEEVVDVSAKRESPKEEVVDVRESPKEEVVDVSVKKESPKEEVVDVSVKKESLKEEVLDVSAKRDSPKEEVVDVSAKKESLKEEVVDISAKKESPKEEVDVSAKRESPKEEVVDISEKKECPKEEVVDVSVKRESPKEEVVDVSAKRKEELKKGEEAKTVMQACEDLLTEERKLAEHIIVAEVERKTIQKYEISKQEEVTSKKISSDISSKKDLPEREEERPEILEERRTTPKEEVPSTVKLEKLDVEEEKERKRTEEETLKTAQEPREIPTGEGSYISKKTRDEEDDRQPKKKEHESRIPISTAMAEKEKSQKPKEEEEEARKTSSPEEKSPTDKPDIQAVEKKKEFESRIPKRVTEKSKTEERISEHTSTTKSKSETFSKTFMGDPKEAFKMFEDMEKLKQSEFGTVTSIVDHTASVRKEKREVISSEITSGSDKFISHEEKEHLEKKKSSETTVTKESPTETLKETESKVKELDSHAVQKTELNIAGGKEIIDASATQKTTETKEKQLFKQIEDKTGLQTELVGESKTKESDVGVTFKIEKDLTKDEKDLEDEGLGDERSSQPETEKYDEGKERKTEEVSRKELHKESVEISDAKSHLEEVGPEKVARNGFEGDEETPETYVPETLEKRQKQLVQEFEVRNIAETLIQSIENEIEKRSVPPSKDSEIVAKTTLASEYLEYMAGEKRDSDSEQDKLADNLTRKLENMMKKTEQSKISAEVERQQQKASEEVFEKESTRDSISTSEDLTRDEDSSKDKEESLVHSSQVRFPDRDITISPSSISDQMELEESADLEMEKKLEREASKKISGGSSFDSKAGDMKYDVRIPKEAAVSEISGARVLEILEPEADDRLRQDSMDVSSIEIDEQKVSEDILKDFPTALPEDFGKEVTLASSSDSKEVDSKKLSQDRDITFSPSTVSEQTDTDFSFAQERKFPDAQEEFDRPVRRSDSFEIESPPLVSPKLKVKELEIKPVNWMIGDEKIEISEPLQPSQAFNKELEELEHQSTGQKGISSSRSNLGAEEDISRTEEEDIAEVFVEKAKPVQLKELIKVTKTKFTVTPVSEQDLENELVENKLEVSCQELVDTLQKEYEAKTPTDDQMILKAAGLLGKQEADVEPEEREKSKMDEETKMEQEKPRLVEDIKKLTEQETAKLISEGVSILTAHETPKSVAEGKSKSAYEDASHLKEEASKVEAEDTSKPTVEETPTLPVQEEAKLKAEKEEALSVTQEKSKSKTEDTAGKPEEDVKDSAEVEGSKPKVKPKEVTEKEPPRELVTPRIGHKSGDESKGSVKFRGLEKLTEKRDKQGHSSVPSDTSAFKMKKEDMPSVDLSARYAITVLDQVVKKEIAEVKESLEAAKQDLIEELSEGTEGIFQIKDSPSEFQFKLQPESIPNDLPLLYKPPSQEQEVEQVEGEPAASTSPVAKPRTKHAESQEESKSAEKVEVEESTEDNSGSEVLIKTEKADEETQITVQAEAEEAQAGPTAASRSSSDVENKDDSFSLLLPQPVPRRRQKPSRVSKKITSESEAEMGSSSGESSNYQSCEYDIGSGSRPSSSDIEQLQSGLPSATVSEYETALMSIDQSAGSRPTSQEYQTAASTLSSRESIKSLNSLSSGHLGSIDSTSEHSETLVPSEADIDKDVIEENLECALEEDHAASMFDAPRSSDSTECEIPLSDDFIEPLEDTPCRMKRSSEMLFQEITEATGGFDDSLDKIEDLEAKGTDTATSIGAPLSGDVESVDIMTSSVNEDGIQSVGTQVISRETAKETDESILRQDSKEETQDDGILASETDTSEPKLTGSEDVAGSLDAMQSSTLSMAQQASMSTSSMSGVSVDTVVEKEKSDRHSPDSDSFELVDKPGIIDDFVVVEEVGKEAEEFDSEGKSIRIGSLPHAMNKNFDRDLENLIAEKKEDVPVTGSQVSRTNELFDFESEESPPQASNDDQYSQSYSDEEQGEGGKKWIEMQLQNEPPLYDIEYDRGPLEDIKEEEITDFEVGSSRFGSLGSHKESIGSVGSMRGSYGSTPDYDVLAGKKYFSKSSEHDNVSLSSLQEFEHLESTIAMENAKKYQCGSQDSSNGSLPRRYATSRSGHGDDISLSSLKDFEGLETACREAHLFELRAREEEDLLDHESPENRYKLENIPRTKADTSMVGSFNPSTSGSDDYEKRIKEIDEIIRIAQSNVEKLERQDDTTEDISQIEITDIEKCEPGSAPVQVEIDAQCLREGNIMETSTDSLELDDQIDKKRHPLCRSSDSLEMKTTLDYPSLSSDSLNNVRDAREAQLDGADRYNGARRISSDSLDMPFAEQQEQGGAESNSNYSDRATADSSAEQGSSMDPSGTSNGKTKSPSTADT